MSDSIGLPSTPAAFASLSRRSRAWSRRWLVTVAMGAARIAGAQHGPATGTPNADVVSRRETALAVVHRADSLVALRKAELDRVKSAVSEPERWVDVSGGMFHVRVEPSLESAARAAVASATTALRATGGLDLQAQLDARIPVFRSTSERRRWSTVRTLWMRADTGLHTVNQSAQMRLLDGTAEVMAGRLVALAEELAAKEIDSTLGRWLRSPRAPLGAPAEERWEAAAVELASTASFALRSCSAGDREACLTSLGLPAGGRASLAEWYAPEDYRLLLSEVAIARSDTVGYAARLLCRRRGDRAACDTAAAHLKPDNVPPPFSVPTRLLFLGEVLRVGGPEAFERLLRTPGSLRERMAAAAGVSLDDITDRWLAHVMAARPAPMRVSPGTFLLSLAWSVALGSLAIARRTAL